MALHRIFTPSANPDPESPTSPPTQIGCKGTTRLPGAGKVERKEGALFGLNPTLMRNTSPMKQREAEIEARLKGEFHYGDKTKPSIPDKRDRPVMGIKTSKNFVTANAVEAILQVPKVVESGELNYMKKEDFGKVPSYLHQVKEEIKRENEMIDKYVKEQLGEVEKEPDQYEEMTPEERQELVFALKSKWGHVNANYQKITHLVTLDTAGQIRRKEMYETELTQLEKAIQKLSRPGAILIKK